MERCEGDGEGEESGGEDGQRGGFCGDGVVFRESCGGVFEWGDVVDGWGTVGAVAGDVLDLRFARNGIRATLGIPVKVEDDVSYSQNL